MRRRILLTAAVVLFAPPPAAATPFGELPSQPVDGAATCLRATGAPGELVRQSPTRAEYLRAGPAGLSPAGTLALDRPGGCVAAAARSGGAGVLAYLSRGTALAVHAYVRDPGGDWSVRAAPLPPRDDQPAAPDADVVVEGGTVLTEDVVAAVSGRGDALVAVSTWEGDRTARVRVARRAPGTGFGAPVTVWDRRQATIEAPTLKAGVAASGEAVIAWAGGAPRTLWAASAPAGAAFGAPQRIGTLDSGVPFDLAVGADGRTLLVFAFAGRLMVAERAPAGPFAAAGAVARAGDAVAVLPAVALRDDGAAVVAWTEVLGGRAGAVVRERPGAFGAPVTLGAPPRLNVPGLDAVLSLSMLLLRSFGGEFGVSGADPDRRAANPRATFTADGRALITWGGLQRRDRVLWAAPQSARLAMAGGPPEVSVHGAELRDVGSLAPVVLEGGGPAVAWTDNDAGERRGRLHLAIEGAVQPADPPEPRVRVGSPPSRILGPSSRLSLPVSCSAACDVRAQVEGSVDATATLSRSRAGRGTLVLESTLRPIAPLRPGPVRVLVRYGAPGARRAAARTFTFTLSRRASAPTARIRGLSARRDGDGVVVRWRTDRPVDPDTFLAWGETGGRAVAFGEVGGRRRTRFQTRLSEARDVDRVVVWAATRFVSTTRTATARVRG